MSKSKAPSPWGGEKEVQSAEELHTLSEQADVNVLLDSMTDMRAHVETASLRLVAMARRNPLYEPAMDKVAEANTSLREAVEELAKIKTTLAMRQV